MPDLVGAHAVPAADRAFREQEVDRGECGASATAIGRLDREGGAPDLAVVAALGMGRERERADQLLDTRRGHRVPRLEPRPDPTGTSCAATTRGGRHSAATR